MYFTVWNFHLCILLLGLSFYGSVRNLRNKQQTETKDDVVLRAVELIMQVELSSLLLVVLVTWTVLLPSVEDPSSLLNWTSYFQHGINAILLLIEYALNATRFNPRNLGYVVLWPTMYAVFHMLYTGLGSNYAIYFFLDMTTPFTIITFLVLLLIHILFFYICKWIGMKKNKNINKIHCKL